MIPVWSDKDEAAYKALEEAGEAAGIEHSTWSVSDIWAEDLANPHPYVGATHVIYSVDKFWNGVGGNYAAEIQGDTYLDLWKAADKVIGASGDEHHHFIEDFAADGSPHLTLHTGS
jgi:hypothetical protein